MVTPSTSQHVHLTLSLNCLLGSPMLTLKEPTVPLEALVGTQAPHRGRLMGGQTPSVSPRTHQACSGWDGLPTTPTSQQEPSFLSVHTPARPHVLALCA